MAHQRAGGRMWRSRVCPNAQAVWRLAHHGNLPDGSVGFGVPLGFGGNGAGDGAGADGGGFEPVVCRGVAVHPVRPANMGWYSSVASSREAGRARSTLLQAGAFETV